MNQFRDDLIHAGLAALYYTGTHHLLRPIFGGVGAIFTMHHVRPPNRSAASMAYDAATKNVVLFGGVGSAGDSVPFGDTWTWG